MNSKTKTERWTMPHVPLVLTCITGCSMTKDCIGRGDEHLVVGYYIASVILLALAGSGKKASVILGIAGIALFLYA